VSLVRRLQIYMDEALDERLEAEALRRGLSKAALIRNAVAQDLGPASPAVDDPWSALVGWLADEPVADIDELIYGGHG
jgi:hypothetical protein